MNKANFWEKFKLDEPNDDIDWEHYQSWERVPARRRLSWFGKVVIDDVPDYEPFCRNMRRAYSRFDASNRGGISVFHGPPNLGKSALCHEFVVDFANAVGGESVSFSPRDPADRRNMANVTYCKVVGELNDLKPIVVVKLGGRPTYNGLLFDLIHALMGKPPAKTANGDALSITLTEQLTRFGVRLLVLDQAHVLVDALRKPDQTSAKELLVRICDLARTEIALVGSSRLSTLLGFDPKVETEAEIHGLKWQEFAFSPLPQPTAPKGKVYTDKDRPPFVAFLEKLASEMPFSMKPSIAEWPVANNIWLRTQGRPAAVMRDMITAVGYAIEHEAPTVTNAVLRQVFDDLLPSEVNHFGTVAGEDGKAVTAHPQTSNTHGSSYGASSD